MGSALLVPWKTLRLEKSCAKKEERSSVDRNGSELCPLPRSDQLQIVYRSISGTTVWRALNKRTTHLSRPAASPILTLCSPGEPRANKSSIVRVCDLHSSVRVGFHRVVRRADMSLPPWRRVSSVAHFFCRSSCTSKCARIGMHAHSEKPQPCTLSLFASCTLSPPCRRLFVDPVFCCLKGTSLAWLESKGTDDVCRRCNVDLGVLNANRHPLFFLFDGPAVERRDSRCMKACTLGRSYSC